MSGWNLIKIRRISLFILALLYTALIEWEGPNLGLVDIKLYVIDEYLRPAGDWGIILVITITTTKPTSASPIN